MLLTLSVPQFAPLNKGNNDHSTHNIGWEAKWVNLQNLLVQFLAHGKDVVEVREGGGGDDGDVDNGDDHGAGGDSEDDGDGDDDGNDGDDNGEDNGDDDGDDSGDDKGNDGGAYDGYNGGDDGDSINVHCILDTSECRTSIIHTDLVNRTVIVPLF